MSRQRFPIEESKRSGGREDTDHLLLGVRNLRLSGEKLGDFAKCIFGVLIALVGTHRLAARQTAQALISLKCGSVFTVQSLYSLFNCVALLKLVWKEASHQGCSPRHLAAVLLWNMYKSSFLGWTCLYLNSAVRDPSNSSKGSLRTSLQE